MAKIKKTPHPPTNKNKLNWFENLTDFKKDLISIALLFLLVSILFNQIIFKNMIFSESGDTAAAHAWATAGEHLEKTENQKPLWFPYIFGGMPGFGSLAYIPYNVSYLQTVVHFFGNFLFLNSEMGWLILHYFLAGLFMFILARTWKFKQLPSLLAAIIFMLSPYAIGLAVHGHGSKMMALSYIPLLLLLTHTLFEKRNVLSIGLLAVAIGTALLTNHVQMVYYGFMLIGLYTLYDFIINIKSETKISFYKIGLFIFAFVIGFAISAYVYLSVYEYSQFSIRGGGDLGISGGLNYDYATNWSFHPFETINLIVPSFFGFSSPYYWGWMPFTDTTVYFGIIPIILSIFTIIFKRTKATIFFITLTIILFIISFGKHFGFIYDLLFNYLPYFNKFRAPSMILHLLPLSFGVMAAYGLTFLIELPSKFDTAKIKKLLLVVGAILLAILILGTIGKSSIYSSLSNSMFEKEGEIFQLQQQYGAQAQQALSYLKEERFNLLWKDFVKFSLISIAALGIIYLYINRKLSSILLSSTLIFILIVDLYLIDTKFIEPKPKKAIDQHFAPDQTVQFMKKDNSQFRIFPLGQLFMDNTWMYHTLESIGGYSPAKIKIYQEMIDSCLYHGSDPMFPLNMNIINMLNTKYLVAQGRLPEDKFPVAAYDQQKKIITHLNPDYQPRVFFVEGASIAKNKSEVFKTLNSVEFDSRKTAVLEKEPNPYPEKSDSTNIFIKEYKSNLITFEVYCEKTSLLVLSEVYYPAGWKAFIDGNETEIYKTNYILRSVIVPNGNHTVVLKFEPLLYYAGLKITYIAWIICLLLIGFGVWKNRLWEKFKRHR